MIIDQDEIDRLLQQSAGSPTADASAAPPAPSRLPAAAPKLRTAPTSARKVNPNLARLLRVRVPVIVRLAQRSLPVTVIRNLSLGAIIDFEKHAEDHLELMVRNQPIGTGIAVRVGEHFGLQITGVTSAAERVASMSKK